MATDYTQTLAEQDTAAVDEGKLYLPELQTAVARSDAARDMQELIARSQLAAQLSEIGVGQKIRHGENYFRSRQPINGVKFSSYRDKTVYRNIVTRHSLLTANDPRPSFMPREPFDIALARVIRKVDDYYWEKMRGSLKYKLMVLDELKYGVGFLMVDVDAPICPELSVPTLAEIGVADWTCFDMAAQPYIYRLVLMPLVDVYERWPHIGKCNPADYTSEQLQLLNEIWSEYWKVSGSDPLPGIFSHPDKMKEQLRVGNACVYEFWYKREDKVYRAYIVNGQLAECVVTDLPDYPIFAFRNRPSNKAFLGMSEADVSADISDSRTSLMQSLLFHDAIFGKPAVEYDEQIGMDAAEVRMIFERPGTAFPVPHNIFSQGGGLRFIQPQPLPSSKLDLLRITEEIADSESGRTKWLEGTVASGSDPAAKVAALQGAGMNQIKTQATMNDQDGLYRFGAFMLWFYQSKLTAPQVIRITGEKQPDGSPMFIDINLEIKKAQLGEMMAMASQAGENNIKFGNTTFTPQEIMAQTEMIHERIDKTGGLDIVKLNDLSAGRFDISIQDSDALPYSETQKKNVMGIGLQAGVVSPLEWREAYGLDTSEAAIESLPITQQQRMQEQQIAAQQQMEQTPPNMQGVPQRLAGPFGDQAQEAQI